MPDTTGNRADVPQRRTPAYVPPPESTLDVRSETVLVTPADYEDFDLMFGRTVLRGDVYLMRVQRSHAIAAHIPFIEDDGATVTRQAVANCSTCGRRHRNTESNVCVTCVRRAAATREAVENGGRRFGIELEFGLPGSDDNCSYNGYDYDDTCDCYDCRQERLESRGVAVYREPPVLDSSAIALALSNAGVPCAAPGYTHEVMDQWKIVTDGSLTDGYELVSPPLQWAQVDQVRIACEVLRRLGMETVEEAGLHVHHDVGDMTTDSARTLASNWATAQPHTDRLVEPGRLGNDYCYPPSDSTVDAQCTYDGESLNDFLCIDGERYRPLNWTCWSHYGTVEVRMHESTFDADEILAWVAYGQSIIDESMAGRRIAQADSIDTLIDDRLTIRQAANPARVRQQLKSKARHGTTFHASDRSLF